MKQFENVTVLFIAGFGPIVRDAAASRKLYNQNLGIFFKEESGGYLHTEAVKGAKTFALWPLYQVSQSCFGKDPGPTLFLCPKPGLSLKLTASKRQRRSLNRKDIKCSSRARKNRGAKL
jgi:hypothetical protein